MIRVPFLVLLTALAACTGPDLQTISPPALKAYEVDAASDGIRLASTAATDDHATQRASSARAARSGRPSRARRRLTGYAW